MTVRTCAMACLVLAITAALCASVGADAQAPAFQIVFQSDRAGNSDLWLVDSNGEDERPLTQTATPEASPSWSPDGTTIVYACAPASNWELCTIDLATRQVTQLTTTAVDEFDPRYTPDGKQIVLETYPTGRNAADIAIMPASGGVPKPLTSTPAADDQDPAPDPNSTRIAFASNGNIKILHTDAPSNVTRVTGDSRGDTDPTFSSRDEIAFASPSGRGHNILVAGRREQGRATKTLTQGGTDNLEPAWTADGREIFFARAQRPRSLRFRIFRMDANGQRQQALTKGGAYADTEPAPQPGSTGPPPRRRRHLPAQAAAKRPLSSKARGCHHITGNDSDNKLNGTQNRDCIHGKAGNDRLTGYGGSDDLYGEDGNDRLYASGDGQQDYVSGGPGADEAWIDDGDTHTSTVIH